MERRLNLFSAEFTLLNIDNAEIENKKQKNAKSELANKGIILGLEK
jgi:hypothetical protein